MVVLRGQIDQIDSTNLLGFLRAHELVRDEHGLDSDYLELGHVLEKVALFDDNELWREKLEHDPILVKVLHLGQQLLGD